MQVRADLDCPCFPAHTAPCRRILIQEFFDKADNRVLCFYTDAKDQLTPSLVFPAGLKKKAVFFRKNADFTINNDNVKTLECGDASYTPVEQVSSVVGRLLVDLIDNNSTAWPGVVSDDIGGHANNLKGSSIVMTGQVKGMTVLPTPPGTEKIADDVPPRQTEAQMNSVVHSIETSVIKWAHQIRDVLKRDSADLLIRDENAMPFVELEFWKARHANLTNIFQQLNSPRLLKMKSMLEAYQSGYSPAFNALYSDVAAALKEAEDINNNLGAARSTIEDFEQKEFEHAGDAFHSVLHLLSIIWKRSTYYNTARHLVVILSESVNLLISIIRGFIDPATLLKLEPEEASVKLQHVLKTIDHCIAVFHVVKKQINEEAEKPIPEGSDKLPIAPWEFDEDLIFARLKLHRVRIQKLNSYINTVLDFVKLEKIEIGIERWNTQIKSMYEQFILRRDELGKMSEEKFDCFDPKNPGFDHAFENFNHLVYDYDRRLASMASLAFSEAGNFESSSKLIISFQGLLDRPVIASEFLPNYSKLLAIFDKELDTIKTIFDVQKVNTTIPKNMPRTAGLLLVAKELRERLQKPRSFFDIIQHPVFQSKEANRLFAKYDEMVVYLSSFEASGYNVCAYACQSTWPFLTYP